jgi:hypothetical protein
VLLQQIEERWLIDLVVVVEVKATPRIGTAERGFREVISSVTSLFFIFPVSHRFVHVDLAKQANIDFVAFGINDNILFYFLANHYV